MAGIYVNDEGTWKLPKSIWINQLGTWRVCSNVYVNSGGAWKELIKTIDITSSKSNFNLYEHIGSPAQAISIVVNIASTVEIFSNDVLPTKQYAGDTIKLRNNVPNRTDAFTVGNFPNGSTVVINNNGYISGGGGFGGAGARNISSGGTAGSGQSYNGGDGSYGITKGSNNDYDCTIVNTGTIAGSGGGGGGGGYVVIAEPYQNYVRAGGNGGDGAGITGFSRTLGGTSADNQDGFGGNNGGNGGNTNENGGNGIGGNGSKSGGTGRPAINTNGIEIAVSGTIIGGLS